MEMLDEKKPTQISRRRLYKIRSKLLRGRDVLKRNLLVPIGVQIGQSQLTTIKRFAFAQHRRVNFQLSEMQLACMRV